jgi:hypothetical protein
MPEVHKDCFYNRMLAMETLMTDPDLADESELNRVILTGWQGGLMICHIGDGYSDEEIDAHAPQLEAELKRYYDERIENWDIPKVPAWAEGPIKSFFKTLISTGVAYSVKKARWANAECARLMEKAQTTDEAAKA